jgi:hypothetical protein
MTGDRGDEPLTCAEFVELVTDYLEGAMDRWTEGRFVLHATACPGCETYLDQFRETIRVAGRLVPDDLDGEVRDRLLAAFASWKRGPQERD